MTTIDTMIKMVLDRWDARIKNADTLINSLADETLEKEIAPGKNRGIYLLGHLVAVHDDMLILLDMGEKLYPELHEPFLKSPDKSTNQIPSASELRNFWAKQCEVLKQKFEHLKPEEWFEKHTAVSAEDFAKEKNIELLHVPAVEKYLSTKELFIEVPVK